MVQCETCAMEWTSFTGRPSKHPPTCQGSAFIAVDGCEAGIKCYEDGHCPRYKRTDEDPAYWYGAPKCEATEPAFTSVGSKFTDKLWADNAWADVARMYEAAQYDAAIAVLRGRIRQLEWERDAILKFKPMGFLSMRGRDAESFADVCQMLERYYIVLEDVIKQPWRTLHINSINNID